MFSMILWMSSNDELHSTAGKFIPPTTISHPILTFHLPLRDIPTMQGTTPL